MAVSNRLKNQHLLWRAAFGPMAENAADLDSISPKKLWETLLKIPVGGLTTYGDIAVGINNPRAADPDSISPKKLWETLL